MTRLLVIGGASIDVLHLKDRTVDSAGGAGMYTAMAARRCGARTALFGPRPDPCPERLKPVAGHLTEWLGPAISPALLPQFEISYRGGKTEYLKASLDAEATLSPTTLPADLSQYDLVHVTPLGDALTQLSFVEACRGRGAKQISAGTGLFIAEAQPGVVRAVMELSDYFFMNDLEAKAVFGSDGWTLSAESARTEAGRVIYLTLGAEGACIIQGDTSTTIPAVPTTVLDPTGAGDTFCGATLAYLLQKQHPIMAARHAVPLAAEMITQVGPTALLSEDPPPEAPLDARVQVNHGQVRAVAEKVSTLPEASPFPFVSPELPPVGHPKALDFFFAATLQQFSFWSVRNNRYDQPLIAKIGGTELKGSDYLWEAFRRQVEADADFCSPERQANLSREELLEVFRADTGDDAMPALDLHLEQARDYGRDMLALNLTPQAVLGKALASAEPLQTFIATLDHIGGYKEDPLRKKSSLLALILNQRPENFLPLRDDEQVAPVIDYHALRSCLRVGLIDVMEKELKNKLLNRQTVSPAEEWAVRYPAYRAREQVVALSGKSEGAVDWFFFGARKRCPEMSEPECQLCQVDPVCAHRVELFQPVLRTSFY
jgi:sugar/nucleoside kinase (ribokinase family)